MKPTDLALNSALGMREAPAGAAHILELPDSPLLKNHVGTMHAAAQFALAESASGACLQRQFPKLADKVIAVVRQANVKYRKPATGDLFAFAEVDETTRTKLEENLKTRPVAQALVNVSLKDARGTVTLTASFEWFLVRRTDST